jgi:hypothetical protein
MRKRRKKRRGPKPTGKGVQIQVRIQPTQLTALYLWIAAQPSPKPTRPQAIRALMDLGLALGSKGRR